MILEDLVAKIAKKAGLEKAIEDAKRTKKRVIFLGGKCEDNSWRETIIEEYPEFYFLDPYDKDWSEFNIYDEILGMFAAEDVVFYQGGDFTQCEKEFLDKLDGKYTSFTKLNDLRAYLHKLK